MSIPDDITSPFALPVIKKHSRLGIASFIVALFAIFIMSADVSIVLILQKNASFIENYKAVDSIMSCFTAGLALAGLGLGIVSVTQKDKNKVFGILGLVFNTLYLLGVCSLYAFNVVMLMGS